MKKFIKVSIVFVFLSALVLLFTWHVQKTSIPAILSKTHALDTLYTLAGNKDFVITPLKGGMSASMLYKVASKDKSYVIRFIQHRSITARQREINAQTIASERGWGPKLYAADINEGWIIMQYIKPTPFAEIDRVGDAIYKALGQSLRKIHTGPAFEIEKDAVKEVGERLERLHQEDKIPSIINYEILKNIIDSVQKNHSKVLAPTHRDLNPNNIIFSGYQPFIIDLEDAAQDDPFYDLGTVGIFYIFDAHHEEVFLNAYFNREPTQQEYGYYENMKQVVRIRLGIHFLETAPYEIIKNVSVVVEPLAKLIQDFYNGIIDPANSVDQLKLAVGFLQEAIDHYNAAIN